LLLFYFERERGSKHRSKGRGRGRERIPSILHAEYGARHGAQSHDPEVMTCTENQELAA